MTPSRFGRLLVAVLSVGAMLAGCAQPGGPTPVSASVPALGLPLPTLPTTTSANPAPTDYTPLLLQAAEVNQAGDDYASPPPIRDPDGVKGAEVLMTNADQSRALGITIVLPPDPASVPDELRKAQSDLSTVVPTAPAQPVPVGTGGLMFTGMSHDGLKAVTALVFSQDRAIVRIDFYTRPDVITPRDYALDVGQRQAIAVRVGLALIK